MTLLGRDEHDPPPLRGERAAALVAVARSVQSRMNSVLAAGLVLAVGVAALTWYYTQALTRPSRAHQAAVSASVSRAQGEMPLPSLGRIDPPAPPASTPEGDAGGGDLARRADVPLAEARGVGGAEAGATPANEVAVAPAGSLRPQHEKILERRLAGVVFALAQVSAATAGGAEHASAEAAAPSAGADARRGADASEVAITALLHPGVTDAAQARLLPAARFLVPKGAFIDCTLETAIDSTLPGLTTCITASDTFGSDGTVVLLERGTKLVGETRGQVQQGQARVFVLWTQARTPAGVVVPLDSPATDELGRAGLAGDTQRHFWQRFGAGMLVSLVDGAVQAGVQAANHSGGTVIYSPAGSQDVLTEVLKDNLHIPPTVVKHNGDRIQVLVARDLDFRPVYELRSVAGR